MKFGVPASAATSLNLTRRQHDAQRSSCGCGNKIMSNTVEVQLMSRVTSNHVFMQGVNFFPNHSFLTLDLYHKACYQNFLIVCLTNITPRSLQSRHKRYEVSETTSPQVPHLNSRLQPVNSQDWISCCCTDGLSWSQA